MFKTEINEFINYLSFEKKYSNHTIRAYKKDLNDFLIFLNQGSIKLF